MRFIQSLKLAGLLSFPPDMEPFELESLNVLIGPNGSGKSNFIEAFELLRAVPTDLANAIREGGGVTEWIWKGRVSNALPAGLDAIIGSGTAADRNTSPTGRPLRYRIEFSESSNRIEILDEAIEEIQALPGHQDPFFYYRFQKGRPIINIAKSADSGRTQRHLQRQDLVPDQSVMVQRRDPDIYPEITWLSKQLTDILTFREWSFGRYATLRRPQPADLQDDILQPDARNLSMVLNQIDHSQNRTRFNNLLARYLPRFERMTTKVSGGMVQFYLHERGLNSPIPATRISDGTLRFIAMLAVLLSPEPPPLVCIEEPELGLHPDAVALTAEVLAEASERMQLVVTTHSDALVSALSDRPSAIVACERPGAGTVLRRLDPDYLSEWLEDYALGDLWRMGELGANP